ncbi:hypothetical protein AB1484_17045 [Parafrankia sp. FMc6]
MESPHRYRYAAIALEDYVVGAERSRVTGAAAAPATAVVAPGT